MTQDLNRSRRPLPSPHLGTSAFRIVSGVSSGPSPLVGRSVAFLPPSLSSLPSPRPTTGARRDHHLAARPAARPPRHHLSSLRNTPRLSLCHKYCAVPVPHRAVPCRIVWSLYRRRTWADKNQKMTCVQVGVVVMVLYDHDCIEPASSSPPSPFRARTLPSTIHTQRDSSSTPLFTHLPCPRLSRM